MLFVEKVEGNDKIPIKPTTLGPKTLIVGPNGAGKSSLVNAIELALTKRASDVGGREFVAKEVELAALVPGGEGVLESVLTLSDKQVCSFRMAGSRAKASKGVWSCPPIGTDPLPWRTFREAMRGSPDKARQYLMTKLPIPEGDILKEFPESLRKAAEGFRTNDLDKLIAAIDARVRDLRAQEAAFTSVVGIMAPTVNPPSAGELHGAKTRWSQLVQTITRLERRASDRERYAAVLARAQEAVEAANATDPPLENTNLFAAVAQVIRASVEAGECLCCGTKGALDAAAADEIDQAIRASVESRRLRDAAARAIDDVERLEQAEEDDEPMDLEELKQQCDEAQVAYEGLVKARAAWEEAARVNRAHERRDNKGEIELLQSLRGAAAAALANRIDLVASALIADVQMRLPPTDKFSLVLREGDREVVYFGLYSNGFLRTALSGIEWARVTGAFADTLAGNDFGVIIPEERAFDPTTLTQVMRAFDACTHQVILTSTVPPKGRLPKDWTLVEV